MRLFFDTSALAKRYVQERGSVQVQEICEQADTILLSIIGLPELIATLCRLVREGRINPQGYHEVKQSILADLNDMDVYPISPEVMGHAVRCLENYPLRAMDAIHLGCALASGSEGFVSTDRRQIEAARGEGLNVIEP